MMDDENRDLSSRVVLSPALVNIGHTYFHHPRNSSSYLPCCSSWETATWYLNTSRSTAYREMLDLETEICRPDSPSYHVVARPGKFEESLHTCNKLSGQADWTTAGITHSDGGS